MSDALRAEAPTSVVRLLPPGTILPRVLADGLVVLVVAVWWFASRRLPAVVLPSPQSVAWAMVEFVSDPDMLRGVVATLLRVVASVVAALVVGSALAVLPYRVPVLRDLVLRRLQPFLAAMPSVGWAILGVVWFHVSDWTVVFVQTAILLPFCLVNLTEGLRALDAELLEMARSFGRGRLAVVTKVTLPLLMPYAVAAARMCYGVCWKVALVAELFGSDSGLGYQMYQAQTMSDASGVIATCLVIILLFIAGDALVLRPLARRFAG